MHTIQDWGAFGEIVGGIAVVFTLVYLTLEMRRTSRANHRQTYQAAATAMSNLFLTFAREPELDRLFRAAIRSPEQLDTDELERGYSVVSAYLALMESFYLHNREFGERFSQERWQRVLKRMFALPGGRSYWHQRRWQFQAEFADYIDALLPEGPANSRP